MPVGFIGKFTSVRDFSPYDFRLRKILQISAVAEVVGGVALVGSGLDFIPKLVQMSLDGGVVVDVNAWNLAFYSVVVDSDFSIKTLRHRAVPSGQTAPTLFRQGTLGTIRKGISH